MHDRITSSNNEDAYIYVSQNKIIVGTKTELPLFITGTQMK